MLNFPVQILHGELQESLRNVEQKLDSTSAELQKQKDLNEKLENDLFSIDQHDPSPPSSKSLGKGKGKMPMTSGDPTSDEHQQLADADDLLAGLDLGKADTPTRSTPIPFTNPPNSSSADTSILPIVTSQRDRFRQRNAELEEELRKHHQTISELRAEIKSLQADNLKLYEKVRYMQSYREDASGSAGSNPYAGGGGGGFSDGSRPGSRMGGDGRLSAGYPTAGTEFDTSVNKYQTRYEETINPFEAFRGRVRITLYSCAM